MNAQSCKFFSPSDDRIKIQPKILLGQLGRNGDCLYATAIARQIKVDYPDCHLTWAVSSLCRRIVDHNPFVDAIWEVPLSGFGEMKHVWTSFEQEARNKKQSGEYDEIFLTQTHPGNFQNYDGTVRSSLFRGYPHPITVPVTPVVRLSTSEIEATQAFIASNNISDDDILILFECSSTSGQSFLTPKIALEVAKEVLTNNKKVKFILASRQRIETSHPNIFDGSVLGFREFAEITKYCTLVVGCSSGISWLATSDWAKPLPKVQVLSKRTNMYASMMHDARYFGLSTDLILEMQNCTTAQLAACVLCSIQDGFAVAKERFHTEIPVRFDFYMQQLQSELLSTNQLLKAAQSLLAALDRFKQIPRSEEELTTIINKMFFPYLRILWKYLDVNERRTISGYLGFHEPTKFKRLMRAKSVCSLAYHSLSGNYAAIARGLLLDVFRKRRSERHLNSTMNLAL